MKVQDLMVRDVIACYPHSTLDDVARVMWEHDCGFVPIVESDASARVVGVITDRDACMAAYTRGAGLRDLRVADAMSTALQTCRPGDSLATAEARLAEARVRRLPVVDVSGNLLGVLSLADLSREAVRERSLAKPKVGETEIGVVLAAVCEPRQIAAGLA